MKTKVIFTLLLLIPLFAQAQNQTRTLLEGTIISDSLRVENVTVHNRTANLRAVTNDVGEFMIYARTGDTLLFSSITFRDAQLVLKEKHFSGERLVVKLDVNVNVLDEVIISDLTGNLANDSRKTVKLLAPKYDIDDLVDPNKMSNYKFKEPNNALPQTESQLTGVDFKRLYRLIFKKKKSKPVEIKYAGDRSFTDVVMERFTDYFFIETLKIPKDQIGAFVAFCDKGAETEHLLDPKKEFELTDYLVKKSVEFLKNK